MKLLHLSHRVPYPPNKGDKIRSFHQVRYLGERHDVWCACFADDPNDLRHAAALRHCCREVAVIPLSRRRAVCGGVGSVLTGRSVTEGFYKDDRMRRVLEKWSDDVNFDGAVVFSSGMAPYGRFIAARRKVLDFCDLDSLKWASYAAHTAPPQRWLYTMESRRLRRRELQWLSEFDACTVVTEAEASAIGDPLLRARLHVVGNGVDVAPDVHDGDGSPTHCVGFVGQMDYRPNVDAVCWFAECVWPHVRSRVPQATFEIVGRSPSRRVRALAGREGIRVVGAVDDVGWHLRRFAVSVAPLRMGQGVQNKVLEAMAASKPVVVTTRAATGIDAEDGAHLLVADDPRRMTDNLVTLLKDPVRAQSIGHSARKYVKSRYNWTQEMAKLEVLLCEQ